MKKTKKTTVKLKLDKTIISLLEQRQQARIRGGCPSIGCTETCVCDTNMNGDCPLITIEP